jgi:hypothetical protein
MNAFARLCSWWVLVFFKLEGGFQKTRQGHDHCAVSGWGLVRVTGTDSMVELAGMTHFPDIRHASACGEADPAASYVGLPFVQREL